METCKQTLKNDPTRHCSKRPKKEGYCTFHYNKLNQTPWVRYGLPVPPVKHQAKIRTKLNKGPKTEKEGGFIYCYAFEGEAIDLYKVGMTTRSVKERIKEWQEEHPKHKIILMGSFPVEKNVEFVERIIHLYMSSIRCYRYPTECLTGFRTVLMESNVMIDEEPEGTKLQPAMHKQVEWFAGCYKTEIKPLVKAICKIKWDK